MLRRAQGGACVVACVVAHVKAGRVGPTRRSSGSRAVTPLRSTGARAVHLLHVLCIDTEPLTEANILPREADNGRLLTQAATRNPSLPRLVRPPP